MKIDGLTKLLMGKHLLLKLFLAVFLSLLFVFRLEAQYVLPSEENELQQLIKNDDPNLERIRRIIDLTPRIVFGRDQSGNTPLHDAANYGHADVAALLLDRGAEVNGKITTDGRLFTMLLGADTSMLPLYFLTEGRR